MTTKKDDLVTYFEKFGSIYKVIIPVDDSKGCAEFKGYALVSVENPEVVDEILRVQKHTILNRKVHCSRALGKKEARNMTTQRTKKKLFVGGLSQKTTEDSLVKYFAQYGALDSAYLIFDKNSNNSRCFGFVEYLNPDDADVVHNIKDHVVDSKVVITKFQVLKKNKKGGSENDREDNQQNLASPNSPAQESNAWNTSGQQVDMTSFNPQQNSYMNTPAKTENYQDQYYYQQDSQSQYQDFYYVDNQQYQDATLPTQPQQMYQFGAYQNYSNNGSQNQNSQYGQQPIYADNNGCYYDAYGNYRTEADVGYSNANSYGYYETAPQSVGYDYSRSYDYGYNYNQEPTSCHTWTFSENNSNSGNNVPRPNSGVASAQGTQSPVDQGFAQAQKEGTPKGGATSILASPVKSKRIVEGNRACQVPTGSGFESFDNVMGTQSLHVVQVNQDYYPAQF